MLPKAMTVLDGFKPLNVYAREEKGIITGLGIVRQTEIAIKPKSVSQYLEVSYLIPEFGKKEKTALEKVLKKIEKRDKIKIGYAFHDVVNKQFRGTGLKTQVIVPFAGTRESKNIQHISEVSRALSFPAYDKDEALDPELENYIQKAFSEDKLI